MNVCETHVEKKDVLVLLRFSSDLSKLVSSRYYVSLQMNVAQVLIFIILC